MSLNHLKERIKRILLLHEDAASQHEVIDGIVQSVDFRGAKLWILILAVFVASLGLNTNSAAVIIGAMLISPLMGPIIGMGLGLGIYDFDLLRRSLRNYIVATIFSVLTATAYFLITPISVAQSELLARTSPTIYDVLIALSGGLAGFIALSSKSQRTGNVIPGVAIATALMPPLCTTGFGIATANWAYAAGALYLFVINTIFIAFSTVVGTMFIMKFKKKAYIDQAKETRVKRVIYAIAFVTMIPAVMLTIGMVRTSYFEQRVNSFVQHELHFQGTQVVKLLSNYDAHSFDVVLIGNKVDSTELDVVRNRLPEYKLNGVEMRVFQGAQSEDISNFRNLLTNDTRKLNNTEEIIAQLQAEITYLNQHLKTYNDLSNLSPQLLKEAVILFPQITGITLAKGTEAQADTTLQQILALVTTKSHITLKNEEQLSLWLKQRIGQEQVHVVIETTDRKSTLH